jgi:superfamily I DNA/RNA helicase
MSNFLDQIIPSEPPATPAIPRVWSEFQTAVFDTVSIPETDLLIQAVAGSGKTTTIIEAMKYSPGSSLFMAFNKAIAEDIRRKATPQADVKTLNALGHRLMADNRPHAKFNSRKVSDEIKKLMGDTEEQREFGYSLSRVVGLAKNCALGITQETQISDFINLIEAYQFEIPFDRLSDYAAICKVAFDNSVLDESSFDFDDQLWIPVAKGWAFPHYSNCFVDECQDLSPIQHLMLERLKFQGARIIGVGDRHQAIYGFRGASHDSMDLLKVKFSMKELPLSISYRCSRLVVAAAQEFCPTIRARAGAPEGEVNWSQNDPELFSQYMIVCRNNAPLFRAILAHVRAKQPVQVLSTFLDTFQSFIRSFKSTYTSDLRTKLDRWFEKEREAALRTGKSGKLRGLTDKYETICLLCKDYKLVADMVDMVKRLGESTRGPIFATIHKSKGLEHPNIYILRPDLLGGFGDLTEEQAQQENNLHYVAITRAEETLTYGAGLRK